MIRYKEFKFPQEYKDFTKGELLNAFIRDNVFVWKTSAIYDKKFIDMFKTVLKDSDSNELTWWKLWLKTLLILATETNLTYLQKTLERLFENIDSIEIESFPRRIIDFNNALMVRCRISLFPAISSGLPIFRDPSVPKGVLNMFKHEKAIINILNNALVDSSIRKNSIKTIVGPYVYNNIPDINWSKLILEFMYREAVNDSFSPNSFKDIMKFFVSQKYLKEHSTEIRTAYKDIEALIKPGDDADESKN